MSGFFGHSLVALGFVMSTGVAHAVPLSSLAVQANRPASVFIDGQPRGRVPLTITGIRPGAHNVKIVDETTGFVRYKPFLAPQDRTLDSRLTFEFQGGAPLTEAEKLEQEKQAQRAPGAIAEVAAPEPVQLRVAPRYAAYDPFRYYGGYSYYGGWGGGLGFGRGCRRGGFGFGRGCGGYRGFRSCRRR